jgi:diguanylate cyclase (GGDEF)-like protein
MRLVAHLRGRGSEAHGHPARTAAALFAVASLVTILGLVLPHPEEVDTDGLFALSVASAAVAGVLALLGQRMPAWVVLTVPALGTALVSIGLFCNGERHGAPPGGDEMYYLWVSLWAAYHLGRRALAVHVALILAAYALTLHAIDPGSSATSRWITLSGLVVGTAIVVSLLARRAQHLIAELRVTAATDPLTGLANRRALESAVDRASAEHRRTGVPFAILVLDVDRFKQLNDRLGHAAGDRALVAIADLIRTNLRAQDLAARIGGDEFAILLPGSGANAATVLGHRLTGAVDELAAGSQLPIGLSVGGAAAGPDGDTLDLLLRTADARLYDAKRATYRSAA